MIHPLRALILLLIVGFMTAWAQPTLAARLASIEGQADAQEQKESTEFKLSEQTDVDVVYNVTERAEGCSVNVRLYREHNGRWRVVSNVLSTTSSKRGSRALTLPAGSYRIEVVAKHARYSVSVDN